MKTYKLTGPITLHTGIVRLIAEQAKGREHKLEPIKDKKDHYRITGPNQFKVDQEIGYDGEIPKQFADVMEEAGKGKGKGKATINPQNVIDIISVLDDLDNDKDFESNGKPKLEAIEALLDRDIPAVDRDAAWKQHQEEKKSKS